MNASDISQASVKAVEAGKNSIVRIRAGRRGAMSGLSWSNDGLVVTSHHLLESEDTTPVTLPTGAEVEAKVVGRDAASDIALLRVDGPTVAPSWADLDALALGQFVVGLGYAGSQLRVCFGVIGGLGPEWHAWGATKIDRFISADFRPQPGYSGGALFSLDGAALGMNTTALVRGLGITVPHTTLDRVVRELSTHGKVARGYLGVGSQPVRLPARVAQTAGQDAGLIVLSLEPNGPSDRAGVLIGDVIVGVAGKATRSLRDLFEVLAGDLVDKAADLRLVRAGKIETISVTVGHRP